MKRTEVDDADSAASQLYARVQKLKQAEARVAEAAGSGSAVGGAGRAAAVDLRESPEPVVDLRESPSPEETGDKKSAAIVID